jgi:cupin fold WbuC family metalloprotein
MIKKIEKINTIPLFLNIEDFCKLNNLRLGDVYNIDNQFINKGISMAKKSLRKRFIINLHKNLTDKTHRFINILTKDTYAQPHKHTNPVTFETFTTLKGAISVIEFNKLGKIINRINIGKGYTNKVVEVQPNTIHTVVPLTSVVVLLEIKGQTNYDPKTDKYFYDWAPKEGDDPKKIKKYLKKLTSKK